MPAQSHVVIGIHGLSPKPPKNIHEADWVRAICEGLKRNFAVDVTPERLGFELVYWADWIKRDEPFVDKEPYHKAPGTGPLPSHRLRFVDEFARRLLGKLSEPVDWVNDVPSLDWIRRSTGLDDLGASLLQKRLVDLGTYYSDEGKRNKLRNLLAECLIRHKGKRIMLVAHSMGSIVAYDVLRELGRQMPDLTVDHFVTLGSPLGLPYVVGRIRNENPDARTPSMVRKKWSNFADRRDYVAIDTHLRDDYGPNDHEVEVKDALVLNGYCSPPNDPETSNPHKIYGYLRTPEFSEVVKAFI